MIVRQVLINPEIIDEPFDYFNDANDTINWLLKMNRPELAVKMAFNYGVYMEKLRARNAASLQLTTKEIR